MRGRNRRGENHRRAVDDDQLRAHVGYFRVTSMTPRGWPMPKRAAAWPASQYFTSATSITMISRSASALRRFVLPMYTLTDEGDESLTEVGPRVTSQSE